VIDVRTLDPTDLDGLRAWWEVGAASTAHDRPYDAWPAWDRTRVTAGQPRSDVTSVLLSATEDGIVVGSGHVKLFELDNRHLAEVDVHVTPSRRRRGIGRRLLAEAERLAVARARTTLVASAFAPVDAESPSSYFAVASGYDVASAEETKIVDLTVAPTGWAPLEADVAAHVAPYRVATFEDRVPEEWVEDVCAMLSAFMTLIPQGDLDLEEAVWTAERLHEYEERTLASGRSWLVAVGIGPDGRLVGFHELGVTPSDPRLASVGGTLVLPGHRGHRLGLGMKLATHRRLLELHPGCEAIETSNAGVNAPMNAVNEALGYRVVERCLDVQKQIDGSGQV
jgi:GNAT superfamily N-acetyltransferase